MIQSLIGGKKYKEIQFWILDNGILGASFECLTLDLEKSGVLEKLTLFSENLKDYSGITLRWHFKACHENFESLGHKRSEAIETYGSKKYRLYLHFEKKVAWIKAYFKPQKKHNDKSATNDSSDELRVNSHLEEFASEIAYEKLNAIGFNMRSLPLGEVTQFLHDENQAIALNGVNLESAGKVIKCLKLNLPVQFHLL